jgi:KaiC/GvpD/RAD55 family RecA-like ATPase
MDSEEATFDYLARRLVHAARERSITVVMTSQFKNNGTTDDLSDFGIPSLIDTIIRLRYIEEGGGGGLVLQVYKSRGSKHAAGKYRFEITGDGVDVEGAPSGRASNVARPGCEMGGPVD